MGSMFSVPLYFCPFPTYSNTPNSHPPLTTPMPTPKNQTQ